jgi:hypothetical protein
MRYARFAFPMALAGMTPVPAFAQTDDAVRGMYLYENHCMECHTSVVHVRENTKATTPGEVEAFVRRWMTYLDLPWTDEEVRDVLSHLQVRYYKF